MKDLIIIDYNNLMHMSYYTSPYVNEYGKNINAIIGFITRVANLKSQLGLTDIVFCADLNSETFRHKLYKKYKGNRKEKPDDLIFQIDMGKEVLKALGYPVLSHPDYEADDIIGMLCNYYRDKSTNCIIISNDKDLYQLLEPHTSILTPRGVHMNREEFYDRYRMMPDIWIDYKILVGDPGDNIPGVSKIGEVTALKLLAKFHTLEKIIKNIDRMNPAIAERLRSSLDKFDLVRKLVTIETDQDRKSVV